MQYRTLGRTGLDVSQLGFGAMRLPMVENADGKRVDDDKAIAMIHRAFEGGVNYIDTAVGYCNRDSQRTVGLALKGWRDKVVVSTKNPYFGEDEDDWWANLHDSLRLLDIETIDIYNMHGVNGHKWDQAVKPRVMDWMQQAKEQGKIRHICASYHDNNETLQRILDDDLLDVITVQYNLLDRKLEPALATARAKNVGVIVMGPVAGGRLGVRSDVLEKLIPGVEAVPELALRFVLANPNVTVALSGMSTMQHVEENLATTADPVSLSEADQQAIEAHLARLKEMATLYCTGCGYCLPCPQEVAIPKVFERYNLGRTYGLWSEAKKLYARIGSNNWDKGANADACVQCGICEDKCPQDIPIRKQLAEAHQALTAQTIDDAEAAE